VAANDANVAVPLRPYWTAYGPVVPERGVDLEFPVADEPVAIAHELRETPDGMHVIRATGPVYAAPGKTWDKTTAWVQTSVAHTRARFIFFTCRGVTS
jgi:hypothetical protein